MVGNDIDINIRTRYDGKQISKADKDIGKLTKKVEKVGRAFKFEFLGTLFFGMAIARMFGKIRTDATQTFRDITESTQGVNTTLTQLAASGEFVSFVLGDAINTALEPLAPALFGASEALTDFVQQNPELVGMGVLLGEIAGQALQVFSAFTLGMLSMKLAFPGLFASLTTWIGHLTKIKLLFTAINLIRFGALSIAIIGIIEMVKILNDALVKTTGFTSQVKEEARMLREELEKSGMRFVPPPEHAFSLAGGGGGTSVFVPEAFETDPEKAFGLGRQAGRVASGATEMNTVNVPASNVTINFDARGSILPDTPSLEKFLRHVTDQILASIQNKIVT